MKAPDEIDPSNHGFQTLVGLSSAAPDVPVVAD
jgi:hypothetical protein